MIERISVIFKKGILSSNMLKLIAMITMTIDHAGIMLFNNNEGFRIVGRIAFPIFAYLIAEGAHYTRNKLRHFLEIFILGVLCQTVYFFVDGGLDLGILLTFSVSIPIVYSIEAAKKDKRYSLLPALLIAAVVFVCVILPHLSPMLKLSFDYGLPGILLPVVISIPDRRDMKLAAAELGLITVCISSGTMQWFSMLALIPLALYNGERGRFRFKYIFYVFYPLHLAVLYLISQFI